MHHTVAATNHHHPKSADYTHISSRARTATVNAAGATTSPPYPFGQGWAMIRAGGRARHTFGSDPDAAEWVSAGNAADRSDEAAAVDLPPHPIWWTAARERANEVGDMERARIIGQLLDHVEQGWAVAAELMRVAETHLTPPAEPTQAGEMMAHLLGFVTFEIAELFTTLAFACSTLVPARWDAAAECPSPHEIERVGAQFSRNVLMVLLASSDPVVSESARANMRSLSRELWEWCPDFSVLAVAAAQLASPPTS